ncbi:MAG: adenylate cyclase [Chloroflexota bacterium]|nr:adenylate cyclase [Chloroflexota bacterium]
MPDPSSTQAHEPRRATITRGFLFADLRGYTAFVERNGAHRAAAMLDRYRVLVRSAVAEFDGAEIRTEGDSFYVVFDGASAAIECGLAIVAAAVESSSADPTLPIHVGVGIHAGETVETTEGFVGSAVNTAARICAQAGPNEVFVSATVRALTGGVVDATFIPVGRRRLKGLSEPIQLFRVAGPGAASAATRSRAPLPLIGALGLVGGLAVALLLIRPWMGATQSGVGTSTEPSASPSLVASPVSSPSGGAFPTGGEVALVALIPAEDRDRCAQASPEDTPELREVTIAGVPAVTYVNKRLIAIAAGIECELGGITAPDALWYWELRDGSEAVQWIAQQAGAIDAPSGTCATATPAVEQWEFGDTMGSLLCYTSDTGDAILVWNYDGSDLMGRAVRDDQDMAELLRWWSEEARFAAP